MGVVGWSGGPRFLGGTPPRVVSPQKLECPPPEPPSVLPPAVVARQAFGKFDHNIQFTATDFVLVAKAAMRLPHQLTETSHIAGTEAPAAFTHPFIFLNHMTAPLIDCLRNIS